MLQQTLLSIAASTLPGKCIRTLANSSTSTTASPSETLLFRSAIRARSNSWSSWHSDPIRAARDPESFRTSTLAACRASTSRAPRRSLTRTTRPGRPCSEAGERKGWVLPQLRIPGALLETTTDSLGKRPNNRGWKRRRPNKTKSVRNASRKNLRSSRGKGSKRRTSKRNRRRLLRTKSRSSCNMTS